MTESLLKNTFCVYDNSKLWEMTVCTFVKKKIIIIVNNKESEPSCSKPSCKSRVYSSIEKLSVL